MARSANKWYLCDYFGEDKDVKVRVPFDIEADQEFINDFENEIKYKTFRNTTDIDRLLEELAHRKRQYNNVRTNASPRLESVGDVLLDSRQLGERSNTRTSDDESAEDIPEPPIRFSRTPKPSTDPAIEKLNQLWENN